VVAVFYRLRCRAHSPRGLSAAAASMLALVLAACGGSTKPQVDSITFTSDAAGQKPICTAGTPSGDTPACTAALLPALVAGGSPLYMFADISGDDLDLGVTWTVSCSSSGVGNGGVNTSCGTFVPASTLSGPVPLYPESDIVTTYNGPTSVPKGGSVTITAQATSLPSASLSISLNVTAPANAEINNPGEAPRRGMACVSGEARTNEHGAEAARQDRGSA
jgi:hypothetical protein